MKIALTIEEHAALGQALKEFDQSNRSLLLKAINSVPKQHRLVRVYHKFRLAWNEMRIELEHQMCKLVPVDDPVWDWGAFYSGGLDRHPDRRREAKDCEERPCGEGGIAD